MEDLITAYKSHFIYAAIVITSVITLHILTNILHKWLLKNEQEKFPLEKPTSINIVKRILNTLWLVLGMIAISFIFVEREQDAALVSHFKLALYLGVTAIFTIVTATTANIWFKSKIRKSEDPTSSKFLRYVVLSAIFFTGFLIGLLAFPSLRGVAQTALGGAGVLALVFGIASQEALANVIGGVFIISFKPFKIGDTIKVNDTMVGTAVDITLRHTIIRNFENKMIVIPNAIINNEKLINYNLGELKCCERIEIKISFDSNVDLAKKIMREECENHPLILDNRTELEIQDGLPIVRTALIEIGDYFLTVRAWAWGASYTECFQLKTDVLETIKKRFDHNNIEITFPYRSIVMKPEKDNSTSRTD